MAIGGKQFRFDNTSSTRFGDLIFAYIDTDYSDVQVEGSYKYETVKTPRENILYIQNVQMDSPLSFEGEIVREGEPFTDSEIQEITNWLFNRNNYKKLEIIDDTTDNEYTGTYYNCILTSESSLRYGDGQHGFKFTVNCNAPYGFEFEKTQSYTSLQDGSTIDFYNNSDNVDGYLRPTIKFTTGTVGGNVSITNNTNNSVVTFTGLNASEIILVDKFSQVISSTGLSRFSNFTNHKNLLLSNGKNTLQITGNITSLDIIYENIKRKGV